MDADDDVDGEIVEDPTEEKVVTTDELDLEDAAREEEGEDVEDAADVAEDT